MKHILEISAKIGKEIPTRKMVERLENELSHDEEYLLDMSEVTFVSRSAADEFFNLVYCDYHAVMANMEPFVKKMMDAVSVSRFNPRSYSDEKLSVIHCETMEDLKETLLTTADSI